MNLKTVLLDQAFVFLLEKHKQRIRASNLIKFKFERELQQLLTEQESLAQTND